MSSWIDLVEMACEVVKSTKDAEIIEKDKLIVNVRLSKPRKVVWLHNDNTIESDERATISASSDGLDHTVTINCATLDDNGTYVAQVDDLDYGTLQTSCNISVKGDCIKSSCFYLYLIIYICLDSI